MGNSTYATNHVIPIFITNPNKPKVNSLSGKKNIFNIGFIIKLSIPIANPIKNRVLTGPVKIIPGINSADRYIAKIPPIIWKRNLFIRLF